MGEAGSELANQIVTIADKASLLTESEYRLFRDLIYEECGISFGQEKRAFFESKLKKRMDEYGLRNGYDYYNIVRRSPVSEQEMSSLLDSLMISETSFFRNQPQFELFRQSILPEIAARKSRIATRSIRVWSAGCSTGQEPYSVVMTMLEELPDADTWSLRAFASDLSFTALDRAQSGRYRPEQLKGVSEKYLQKYFAKENVNYLINERVKRHVIFDYHNLKNDNGLRGLDVIFCRNVMIYFDTEEQRRLVERFATCLTPGGYLFIGHAESLQGLSKRFTMIHANKGIAYRFDS